MPMIRDFLMPDLGEGLTEGEINRWLVAEGDAVVVDAAEERALRNLSEGGLVPRLRHASRPA